MKPVLFSLAIALGLSGLPAHANTISLSNSSPVGVGSLFDVFTQATDVAILHFRANSIGATTIGVTSDPTDLNQGLICADLPCGDVSASGSVTVAAVPEPPMMVILGLCLMALYAAYARRRA